MELADILQQLGLTQEDRDAARRRAIGTFGFGLLGARKGREGEALGRAGLLGMNARDQALADAQQGKMRDFQIQQYAAKMKQQEAAAAAAEQEQQAITQAGQDPYAFLRGSGQAPKWGPQDALMAQMQAAQNPATKKSLGELAVNVNKEFGPKPKTLKDQKVLTKDGKRVVVNVYNDGTYEMLPFDPDKEKLHFANTGATVASGFDPYSGQQVTQGAQATMDPAQADASKRGWANLGLERDKFGYEKQKSAEGGAVKPTFHEGQWVYPPTPDAPQGRAAAVPGFQYKMPEAIRKELASIDAQANIIDSAMRDVKKHPSAFSAARGMATLAGTISESVAGRLDSKNERETRAYVFNIVSKVINERAGAAQSKQELARLRSFLPSETDNAAQVTEKLESFRKYLDETRKGYQSHSGAPQSSGTSGGWSITEAK